MKIPFNACSYLPKGQYFTHSIINFKNSIFVLLFLLKFLNLICWHIQMFLHINHMSSFIYLSRCSYVLYKHISKDVTLLTLFEILNIMKVQWISFTRLTLRYAVHEHKFSSHDIKPHLNLYHGVYIHHYFAIVVAKGTFQVCMSTVWCSSTKCLLLVIIFESNKTLT